MKFLIALALLFSSAAYAETCEQFTPHGIPEVPGAKTTQICRTAYVVKYFDDCKVPFYVAEHLEAKEISGNEARINFIEDMSIPLAIRAFNSDYVGTGYDRGHMAAAANFRYNEKAMHESFYLTNAIPQAARLNRGSWRAIEMRTRALAVKFNDVYVFSGGIFAAKPQTIGNGVCVPTHTYKIVIDKKKNQSIAWLTPNEFSITGKSSKFIVPMEKIEQMTGINFTPNLSKGAAQSLKSTTGNDLNIR